MDREAAVAARSRKLGRVAIAIAVGVGAFGITPLYSETLPDDRTDVMYHEYDGGGLNVHGPSILVRKGFADKVSVWGNYYVDEISSASIDVVTTASPYHEKRTQWSGGIDYLRGKSTMSMSYTYSEESDYTANTAQFGITHNFFGDLTTVGITYSRGWNDVYRTGDPAFHKTMDTQNYRVDLSQILTKNWVLDINYEGVTDQGFLNNPYRSVRYLDPSSPIGYSYQAEVYPHTHTSNATALRTMYYLPYRASAMAEVRYYSDTWGIAAWNAEVGYTQPLPRGLTLDVHYRYYEQNSADFYSDLFPRENYQNFMARDRWLATFNQHSVGLGLSYDFGTSLLPFFKRGQISLQTDWLFMSYDDFRDLRKTVPPGTEPEYSMDATVTRAFISLWY